MFQKEGIMELDINNKIVDKQITNEEVNDFINDLSSALEQQQNLETTSNLYNKIMKDIDLARKYPNEVQGCIDKCLKDLSYEEEFLYFDYDMKAKEYQLKYYWKGENAVCDSLTEEDIDELKKSGKTFFVPRDEETIVECEPLKDWIKYEVRSCLVDIDIGNRKKKENK